MFLVCENNSNLPVLKETSSPTSLSTFYSEYNLMSKTITVDSNSLLLFFSSEISNPLGFSLNLIFNIRRYSKDSFPEDIGNTYIFSSNKKDTAKSFCFQFLDDDLNKEKYTYSIVVSSNNFSYIPPALIIPTCNLDFLKGN